MKKFTVLFALLLITCACAVGPKYKRPNVAVPGTYRGAPSPEPAQTPQNTSQQEPQQTGNPPQQTSQASEQQSLGDQKWWDVFQDPKLQELIRTAIQNNYDVRIAATRILEAQAQLGITRADKLPTINAGAGGTNDRLPRTKLDREFETDVTEVSASLAWDLDFWGKYRRATEAARASLLATEWAHRAVVNTLVSNVAASYFQLRAYDLQLEIAGRYPQCGTIVCDGFEFEGATVLKPNLLSGHMLALLGEQPNGELALMMHRSMIASPHIGFDNDF